MSHAKRKHVSVRGDTFERIKARAAAEGVSMAVLLERLMAEPGTVEQIDAPPDRGVVRVGSGIERDEQGKPTRITFGAKGQV